MKILDKQKVSVLSLLICFCDRRLEGKKLIKCFCLTGGEVKASRAHPERKENPAVNQLSFFGQNGNVFQGAALFLFRV